MTETGTDISAGPVLLLITHHVAQYATPIPAAQESFGTHLGTNCHFQDRLHTDIYRDAQKQESSGAYISLSVPEPCANCPFQLCNESYADDVYATNKSKHVG
jgi:hypothetical protein